MADPTEEEVRAGVEAAGRIGGAAGAAGAAAAKKKKKKSPGLWETGKALYKAYMARRKKMPEIGLGRGGIKRKKPPAVPTEGGEVATPTPPPPEVPVPKPVAFTPTKKKKKPGDRGGVGGVLDAIQERKRRQQEAFED
jgi:hypothetical protein